ncbi:hypothetical protein quinque_002429 [Culex quinquefasciatus]
MAESRAILVRERSCSAVLGTARGIPRVSGGLRRTDASAPACTRSVRTPRGSVGTIRRKLAMAKGGWTAIDRGSNDIYLDVHKSTQAPPACVRISDRRTAFLRDGVYRIFLFTFTKLHVSKYSTRINKEVIELKGKSVEKLIASGREKLSSMSSVGAVSVAAAERKEEDSR